MGIGYVFNEQAIFASDAKALASLTHTESLVATQESAFLRIKTSTLNDMANPQGSPTRGTSPHMMGD